MVPPEEVGPPMSTGLIISPYCGSGTGSAPLANTRQSPNTNLNMVQFLRSLFCLANQAKDSSFFSEND